MLNRKTLLITFLIIQVIAIIKFLGNKQYDFAYETLIIIAGSLLLTYLEIKKNLPISNYLRALVFVAISGHTIGGELFGLYVISHVFDKFLHVFGTYSFAMLGYVLLGLYNFPLSRKVQFIIMIMIGLSLGTFYELWEFAIDRFMKPPIAAQSGLLDTNLDLLADLIGSLLAALHISRKDLINRV